MKAGVVAFAFGANWDICSNLRIAEIAREKELRLRSNGASVSIFTQYDVCLEGADHASENDHDPPPTLRIAREAIRWAKERGLKELWIVAAKPHLWRACRDMKASLREAGGGIEIYACKKEINEFPEDPWWFCSASTQARTRSRGAWNRREKTSN